MIKTNVKTMQLTSASSFAIVSMRALALKSVSFAAAITATSIYVMPQNV